MSLNLTEKAIRRILDLIKKEEPSSSLMFRVTVSGGGCSGFQYGFSLDPQKNEDDHTFEKNGVTLVVDNASLPFLEDAQIDFVEDLIGSSFQIQNPNASSSCGCGNSFSI